MSWLRRKKNALTETEIAEVREMLEWIDKMRNLPNGSGLGSNPYVDLLKASKVR